MSDDDEDELNMDYSFDQSGTDAHDMMGFGLPTESERSLMERVRKELKIELKQVLISCTRTNYFVQLIKFLRNANSIKVHIVYCI